LKDTVDAYGLTKYMRLEHEVRGALWDEQESVWKVSVVNLRTKEAFTDTAEILVNNCGVLK
jgi:cation diffusion facilitator CzcD-associated flavoprotein CzcO